ncbi:MAG: hypothetical protein ACFFDF_19230 [Candidatus Odinarchaeota archaeon]
MTAEDDFDFEDIQDIIYKFDGYYVNFSKIDQLKDECKKILNRRDLSLSEFKVITKLMRNVSIIWRVTIQLNEFQGYSKDNIVEQLSNEIEEAISKIISRNKEKLLGFIV